MEGRHARRLTEGERRLPDSFDYLETVEPTVMSKSHRWWQTEPYLMDNDRLCVKITRLLLPVIPTKTGPSQNWTGRHARFRLPAGHAGLGINGRNGYGNID